MKLKKKIIMIILLVMICLLMNNTMMLNMLKQAIIINETKHCRLIFWLYGPAISCGKRNPVPGPMFLPRGPEKPTVVAAARNKPIMALGFKMTSFGPGLNGSLFHQP